MELHPYLEKDGPANPDLWYVLSTIGDNPSLRVGPGCIHIPNQDGSNGKVLIIGGANPSGPFNDVSILDLQTFQWDSLDTPGFSARYEFSYFVPNSFPDCVYIFGGAYQGGNLNDVCVLDTANKTWQTLEVQGMPPCPRTHHTSAHVGDQLIIYSGGQSGVDPVGDRQVHSFDAKTKTWSTINVKGDSPKPRHGHVMVAIGNKVYIHGGMSGTTYYEDLHILNLDKKQWSSVKQKKCYPGPRAAHGAVAIGNTIYVFGGMSKDGALDDMYRLNTETLKWNKVELQGPSPANRLDFGICTIRLNIPIQDSDSSDVASSGQQAKEVLDQQLGALSISPGAAAKQTETEQASGDAHEVECQLKPSEEIPETGPDQNTPGAAAAATRPAEFVFVFGGMDTEGEIFDDCLVYMHNE